MPKDRAFYKSKGKGKDAHELKSCDKGTQLNLWCIPKAPKARASQCSYFSFTSW